MVNLEPGGILGVAHAPLLSVPQNVFYCATTELPTPTAGLFEASPVSAVTVSPLAIPASPSPALLECLSPEQRASSCAPGRICRYIRERWVLTFTARTGPRRPLDNWGMFSANFLDFGSCSLTPSVILVPEGSTPVTSRPLRINPITGKEVEAILDQYLAAGLIQHSTYSLRTRVEPAGGHPEEVWRCSDHRELQETQPDQLVFPIFDLVSSFHQIFAHKETVPLTAFLRSHGSVRVARHAPGQPMLRPDGSSR